MKIIGIDPGTATTGFAVIKKTHTGVEALDFGVITTSKNLELPERLREIAANLRELFVLHQPDVLAVESLFFFKNHTTAFLVAQARGAVLLTAAEHGLPVRDFTPLQVKQAVTGYGRAEKKQIQQMVQQIYALPEIPRPDDAADALAVAFTAS